MSWPDIINGAFETSGAFFIWLSIFRLWRDKRVAGISVLTIGFFFAWGLWNLFYYPHLEQWASTAGGILIVISNAIYVGMLLYYGRRK